MPMLDNSMFSQTMLELKAHAKVIRPNELEVLRRTHTVLPSRTTIVHIADAPKRKERVIAEQLTAVVSSTPKQKSEETKPSNTPLSREDKLNNELAIADKLIQLLYDELSTHQKVIVGKRIIYSNLAGKTILRSQERSDLITL